MIAKPVVHSDHDRPNLKFRGISRNDVRWLMARGDRTPTQNPQQYFATGVIGKRTVSALVIETSTRYSIRTVMTIPEET